MVFAVGDSEAHRGLMSPKRVERKERVIMGKERLKATVAPMAGVFFLLFVVSMAPGTASAAYECFLKIDGIQGESMAAGHKDEIDVTNWNWGENLSATIPPSAGGATAGKVKMQDFKFVMRVCKASPKLFLACATGKHIKSGDLTVRSVGDSIEKPGPGQIVLKISFSDILISSYQSSGTSKSSEASPMDEVSFSFAKIETDYRYQGGNVKEVWDVRANVSR
jgi:type VI secretion system secreted protein Hcp